MAEVYRSLEDAHAEVEKWTPVSEHYGSIFWATHRKLANAIAARDLADQRYTLFPLYDARVEAAHAWGPSKRKLKAALTWRKACLDEAKAINKELGT